MSASPTFPPLNQDYSRTVRIRTGSLEDLPLGKCVNVEALLICPLTIPG